MLKNTQSRDFLDLDVIGLGQDSIVIKARQNDDEFLTHSQVIIMLNSGDYWHNFPCKLSNLLNVEEKEDKVSCFTYQVETLELDKFQEIFNQIA